MTGGTNAMHYSSTWLSNLREVIPLCTPALNAHLRNIALSQYNSCNQHTERVTSPSSPGCSILFQKVRSVAASMMGMFDTQATTVGQIHQPVPNQL